MSDSTGRSEVEPPSSRRGSTSPRNSASVSPALEATLKTIMEEVQGLNDRTIEQRVQSMLDLRNILDRFLVNFNDCEERTANLTAVANLLITLGDQKFVDLRKTEFPELNFLALREYLPDNAFDDPPASKQQSISSFKDPLTTSEDIAMSATPKIKREDEATTPRVENNEAPAEFLGCFAWESRWWLPPYGPNHPAWTQIAPGQPPYGYGYIDAGDGTFQPFTREAALQNYFQNFPVQEPEKLLEAYRLKHMQNLEPLDYGDDTDDKVLVCTCLTYADDREYIQCDNTFDCLKQFFHPECLGMPKELIPTNADEWYCPDCLKEGRGGARNIHKMVNFYARHTLTDAVKTNPAQYIKPWTADALKKNPQTLRELGLSTLEEAKSTLRKRSTRPVGDPIPSTPITPHRRIPTVINGTVVRQPNKKSWTTKEDLILVESVVEVYNLGLRGQPLWDAVEKRLHARGCYRVVGAARNRWMRGLREEYNLDERRKTNANKMTTAIQVGGGKGAKKSSGGAGVKKNNGKDAKQKKKDGPRYSVSRKAAAPAGYVQKAYDAAAATARTGGVYGARMELGMEQYMDEAEEEYDIRGGGADAEDEDGDVEMRDTDYNDDYEDIDDSPIAASRKFRKRG